MMHSFSIPYSQHLVSFHLCSHVTVNSGLSHVASSVSGTEATSARPQVC